MRLIRLNLSCQQTSTVSQMFFAMDINEFPILNINLSGNYTIDELKDYAEYLEDEIEKIKEISKAEIRGVDDKEVKIKSRSLQT